MRIAFVSENGIHDQKIPRNYPHMRTDFAWMVALDATHLNIYETLKFPINVTPKFKLFDIAIYIPPKKLNLNVEQIDKIRLLADKVARRPGVAISGFS